MLRCHQCLKLNSRRKRSMGKQRSAQQCEGQFKQFMQLLHSPRPCTIASYCRGVYRPEPPSEKLQKTRRG